MEKRKKKTPKRERREGDTKTRARRPPVELEPVAVSFPSLLVFVKSL